MMKRAVDSELAMFGVEGVPLEGAAAEQVLSSRRSRLPRPNLPFLVLTARIDAPSYATCERMIHDAVEAEKTGLWGMAYVDIANKFPQGDQWLETVVKDNRQGGHPDGGGSFQRHSSEKLSDAERGALFRLV